MLNFCPFTPKKDILKFQPLVPQNATIFGNRIFTEVIK